MSKEELKSYKTLVTISTILLIVGFFFAGIILSGIAMILSSIAYSKVKYDHSRRNTTILLQSLAIFNMMATGQSLAGRQDIVEIFISCGISVLIYYLFYVSIANKRYGKTDIVDDEVEELNEETNDYLYICPKCRKEIKYGTKYCNYCSTEIDWDGEIEGEHDEDLADYDEYLDENIEEDSNVEEEVDENDEFFKEDFEFSYDKLKEVLKKMGYENFATFRKEVYENKHIKRKKIEDKEEECNYLVKALGYDDFEDFYKENMK